MINRIVNVNIKLKRMYARLILFGCFLLLIKLAGAQKTDSVRLVVNQMGYNLPRLSPIPVSKNPECILSLNGTWLFRNSLEDTDNAEPDKHRSTRAMGNAGF